MFHTRYLYVYILKCSNGTFYTGVTNDLQRRFMEHSSAHHKTSYTSKHLPVELVFHLKFSDFKLAIKWEKRIKKWSHKKKQALIDSDWEKLKEASKCKNSSRAPSRLRSK